MDKLNQLRQYISNWITGPNSEALLQAIADQLQKQDDLSVSVNNQLYKSTAEDIYLDKQFSEIGIVRPQELGMSDVSYRQLGISINQSKQVIESIHNILTTFYGNEAVRAHVTSGVPGSYSFEAGDDLIFELENGETLILTLIGDEFENIQSATCGEISDVITKFIRQNGSNGFAQVYTDQDTQEQYVEVFGGAQGPFSYIKILGGKIQSKLEFPTMRATNLTYNDTVWEITRNVGSTHRFRWVSGSAPLLDKILVGDTLLLYGPQFETAGFVGTYTITGVVPPSNTISYSAGYFEFSMEGNSPLASSIPNLPAPINTPTKTYTITLTQNSYDDLKFFLPKKSTPYSQMRYSLAWEPQDSLLKVYMPATTNVVERDLIGAAHLHLKYGAEELNGSFGSATIDSEKVEVVSDTTIKYKTNGYDVSSTGGTLTWDSNVIDIESVTRENGYVTVITKTNHNIPFSIIDGMQLSDKIVGIQTVVATDDTANSFLGPYIVNSEDKFTLTNTIVKLREKVSAGEKRNTLLVEGILPNAQGNLLFSLNKDNEESPVKYIASQTASGITTVVISSISQVGNTVTVTTQTSHGAVVGQNVLISGTTNFNNSWVVESVPSANVYTFTNPVSGTFYESTGVSTPLIESAVSTLMMDSSYSFKYTQEVGTDITLISDIISYEPEMDGSDYAPYITGTSGGRIFANDLITQITALGIKLEVIIIYPGDVGLGNAGESLSSTDIKVSDALWVWGPE